jgi:hypothetical protein
MHDALICHSEADEIIAIKVALALEEAGYSTWYYERDNTPGESYLIQVGRAIEESRTMIFIASPNSIISNQVTAEVVRAYEARIPCVPLLIDITHRELGERQQTLRQALVTATRSFLRLPFPMQSSFIKQRRGATSLPIPTRAEENYCGKASRVI